MAETPCNERRQQQFEKLCATTIRALTGRGDLRYRGRRLHSKTQRLVINSPHLRIEPNTQDFDTFRGATDGIALRIYNSDPDLHSRLSPAGSLQRFMFEMLEKLRVDSLVPGRLPGVRRNLRRRFTALCKAYHASRLTESHRGILVYTIAQIVCSRLNGLSVLEETEDQIESTRFKLMPLIGSAWAA